MDPCEKLQMVTPSADGKTHLHTHASYFVYNVMDFWDWLKYVRGLGSGLHSKNVKKAEEIN